MVCFKLNITGSFLSKVIPFFIYVLLLSVIISACEIQIGDKKKKDNEEERVLPPVIVHQVSKGSISNILKLNSTVQPAKEVRVFPRSVGVVDAISAEEGQHVWKGQVLARLDTTDQTLAVERAISKLSRSKYDLNRAEEMHKNKLLSENELRQFQLMYREDEINLAQAEVTLNRTVIKAPFAGVITERQIETGDKVDPSQPLFTIVDQRNLKLDVWINEEIAQSMKLGMKGNVIAFSSALTEGTEATLIRLNPVIDAQYGKRKATFELESNTQSLKPGQFVDISLTLVTHSDVIIIPKRALVHQAGSQIVFVCNDSVAVRKEVQTMLETGDNIEVEMGVKVGDLIIVEGQSTLKDSTIVNVINPKL